LEVTGLFDAYRRKELVDAVVKSIKKLVPNHEVRLLHVCGTHEQVISRFGLRSLLPDNLEVIAGPGCPVCCVPAGEIDEAIKIATEKKNVILTTFGDMFKAPGSKFSLWDARAMGGDVRIVYSISDAVELARKNPDKEVVFFAIGFETTAPTTASAILNEPPDNFSVLVSHRLIPPIMELLLGVGETYFDGFICPGHVATIIGVKPFRLFSDVYGMPTVIAGFEPLDIFVAIKILLEQIREGKAETVNEYTRVVTEEGNVKAQKLMDEVFEIVDGRWRGIGRVPYSALKIRKKFEEYDARVKFDVRIGKAVDIRPECCCHLILTGKLKPTDCAFFKKVCTPEKPYGPCMVSSEGTCNIWYRYGEYPKTTNK